MTHRTPELHEPIRPARVKSARVKSPLTKSALRYRPVWMACPMTALILLGACSITDPFNRPGVWNAGHVNDDNLRAMVAVPSDLVRGTGDGRADGSLAEAALMRQRLDKVRKLPDTAIAEVTPTASGDSGSQGGN